MTYSPVSVIGSVRREDESNADFENRKSEITKSPNCPPPLESPPTLMVDARSHSRAQDAGPYTVFYGSVAPGYITRRTPAADKLCIALHFWATGSPNPQLAY